MSSQTHEGVWVKDADKPIARTLRERGRLLLLEQYLHDYPFCWRAKQDPLIQYPRRSWFIRGPSSAILMLQEQLPDRLAARTHPRWPLRQLPGVQRRLGTFARTLLGHTAADLGLPRNRVATKLLVPMTNCFSQPGVTGTEVWASTQRLPIPSCQTICASTSRTSTRSPMTRRSLMVRGCNVSPR